MKLGPRQRSILAAICREYLLSGEAVGSRTLVRRQKIEQSAATVRNVMADLEEQGLLLKPHTSAGRLPTDFGLRFFIDRLMKTRDLTDGEQQEIRRRYSLTNVQLQDLLREISRLLSELSQQCALVLAPRSEVSRLKRIEFVPLRKGQMIAVLVMASGMVQNRLLAVGDEPDADELQRMHNYLNELCSGLELGEVRRLVKRELEKDEVRYDTMRSSALALGDQLLSLPANDEVLVEGQSHLLDHPESNDPDQMKALLRAVADKKSMLRLLDETIDADGVQVFIGAETKDIEMRGCALVAAAYGGVRPVGTLGVIGPTSMNFPRVLPLVDYTAGLLTELLQG